MKGKPVEGVYADRNKDGMINQKDLYQVTNRPSLNSHWAFLSELTYGKWAAEHRTAGPILGNYMYNGITTGAAKI